MKFRTWIGTFKVKNKQTALAIAKLCEDAERFRRANDGDYFLAAMIRDQILDQVSEYEAQKTN